MDKPLVRFVISYLRRPFQSTKFFFDTYLKFFVTVPLFESRNVKGQSISKILPKKERKQVDLRYHSVDCFVLFLEELRILKSPYEIN